MSYLSEFPGSDSELCKIECIEILINSKDIISTSIATTRNYTGSKHDVVYIYAVLEKCLHEINTITNICSAYPETSIIAHYGDRFKKNVENLKAAQPGFTEAFSCMCALSKWIDNSQEYIINDFEGSEKNLIHSISHQWQEIFFSEVEQEFESTPSVDTIVAGDSQHVNDFPQSAIVSRTTEKTVLVDELDEDFNFDADFSASDTILDSDTVVELLANELKGISGDLDDLLVTIVYGEDEQLLTAVTDYVTQVECLMEACHEVELHGVSDVCGFIIENMTILSSQSKQQRECLLDLVQPWVTLVMTYLTEPVTDQTCLNIVNHLDNKNWPTPLSGATWRELFTKLYNDISNTLEADEVNQRQVTVSVDDVDLTIAEDARPEVVDAFMQEAPQLATEFSTHLELIRCDDSVQTNLEAAQRVSHSLKGSANLIGLKGIANLAHNLEDIFELLLKKQILKIPAGLSSTLEESADCIESMIDAVLGVDEVPDNALTVLQSVLDWANKIEQNEQLETRADYAHNNDGVGVGVGVGDKELIPVQEHHQNTTVSNTNKSANTDSIRVPTLTIDDMHRLIGEVSISVGQIQTQVRLMLQNSDHFRQQDIMVQQRRFDLENIIDLRGKESVQNLIPENKKNTDFDALEMDHYDDLYSTTHRYIEAVADSREITQVMQSELVKLDGLFLQQSRLNKELENIVIATRMVPISSIESRLYRNIRQVCRATNKKAVLNLDGLDLMLDVEVLNKLVNPLMHILRNSVDHGIEHEDERIFEQKDPEGKINLHFSHDGNHVLVVCFDDGRGLDYSKIRESAIRKALLRRDHQADNNELARLILTPGFTTRETTTQISGRGVGLDVVHNTIKELKGTLELSDSQSGGLQITIRLPVSLVTSHSLIISSNTKLLALPTAALTQVLAPGSGQFKRLGESMTFQLGKNIYPVKTIASLLNQQESEIDHSETVILIRSDTGIIAVTIDAAVNSVDLVIKSTGHYVGNIPGILGVSILGDGSIIPVLDVLELIRNPITRSAIELTKNEVIRSQPDLVRVLIVDDSLSVRKSLTQLVEDAGFEPIQASDGVEAMTILEKETPDIALIDMEMPRMNGLELTQFIRGNDAMRNLPIIMITSRAQQKHREHAKNVGVNSYVTKPYTEDKLLDEIHILITS